MRQSSAEYTIYDSVTPQTVTSSTDASPAVVTKNSHGLATGDRIVIAGHATNVTVNGIFDVVRLTANTFTLKDINTGTAINGAGAGAGSGGIMCTAPKIAYCEEFRDAVISVVTAGTATLTLKTAGSIGKVIADVVSTKIDTPNFGATQTDSNPYTFVEVIDLDTGTAVDGAVGIAASATDLNKMYEVNVNGLKYFTVLPTAWTQGSFTVKVKLFDNN